MVGGDGEQLAVEAASEASSRPAVGGVLSVDEPSLGGRSTRETMVGDLVKGQLVLFGGVAVGVALRPHSLEANSGISYYGVHWDTFPGYAVGLIGAALFTRRALRAAAGATPAPDALRRTGDWFLLLVLGVVLTPYSVGGLVDWSHRGFGSSMFALQLVLALRLISWAPRDPLSLVLLLIQLAGGVLSLTFLVLHTGYLIQAELLFQLGFGALLIRTVPWRLAPSGAPA